jgi:hypothetical protein
MKNIKIQYDGCYPNACSGNLIVTVNGTEWRFPDHCLSSGGKVWFDKNWAEHVEQGPWSIWEWPSDFPEKYKDAVIEAINLKIPFGCCGGCV